MKKIFIFFILILASCTKQKMRLDLESLEVGLNSLYYHNKNNEIQLLFNNRRVDAKELNNKYDFDSSNIDNMLFTLPNDIGAVSMYAIILPKNNKEQSVKNEMTIFFNKYALEWDLYFPKEVEMIKNRLETTHENYLIYIVSNDNDKVLSYIRKNSKSSVLD